MSGSFPSTLVHTLSTHAGPINALTFSSLGGTYILSGSSDRQIHLSRTTAATDNSSTTATATATTTRSPIQKYAAHGYPVLDISCATDNQTFASVGGDRSVFLWDVQGAVTIRRFGSGGGGSGGGGPQQYGHGHRSRINAVSFGATDDSVLVSGGDDRTVRVWDVRSRSGGGAAIMELDEARDSISAVAVRDVEIVTGSVDGRVRGYDLRMGIVTIDVMPAAVTSVQLSGGGGDAAGPAHTVLVGCLDSHLRLMDRTDGRCLRTFSGLTNADLRIKSCFGRGEEIVMSGTEGGSDAGAGAGAGTTDDRAGTVHVWDVVTGERVGSVDAGAKVVSIVRWRGKSRGVDPVWASGAADGLIRVWGGG